MEEFYDAGTDRNVTTQGICNVVFRDSKTNLLHVTRIGTQQSDVFPAKLSAQHQTVERVVLGTPFPDSPEGILKDLFNLSNVNAVGEGIFK